MNKFFNGLLFLLLIVVYILPTRMYEFDDIYYNLLYKPAFTPNYYTLTIIWIILLGLLALYSTIMIITPKNNSKRLMLVLIVLNYLLIHMYFYIMFYLKDLRLAFVDTVLVLLTTFMLFINGIIINKKASLLILPVLLWLIYASFFQIGIVKLNP